MQTVNIHEAKTQLSRLIDLLDTHALDLVARWRFAAVAPESPTSRLLRIIARNATGPSRDSGAADRGRWEDALRFPALRPWKRLLIRITEAQTWSVPI